MRGYAMPETAVLMGEAGPETLGWGSRLRPCFLVPELKVAVPLVEKAASTSAFWALLQRWRPELAAEAREAVASARRAGDRLGMKMVRDVVQREVTVRTVEELAGYKMVALVRDPVQRFWSAWLHQGRRNAYAETAALRRRVPRGGDPVAAIWWLMQQDVGTVDEHFAPQWSTLVPGAEVFPLNARGIEEWGEATGVPKLDTKNRSGAPLPEVPEGCNAMLRWLLGADVALYEQARSMTGGGK